MSLRKRFLSLGMLAGPLARAEDNSSAHSTWRSFETFVEEDWPPTRLPSTNAADDVRSWHHLEKSSS
jgi:hypothetical protein